ncbi:MAG: hypothetical protein Q9162_002359 [Coniocarpon cinnabarinum]
MGIKGIYQEIGPGKRVALSKLAVEHYEQNGRPLRLAIDISIWLFQIQSSKGGTNPALRTFYYRLLRLISLSIHPLFVFDGPNKPPFKRNKRTGPNVASVPEFLAKQLLKQFGLPFHLAPGEAEAECALLQQKGIVDAVLSEDVDTLMFGSGLTLRSWSPEPSVKTKSPTHVNVYDARTTKASAGLDREGMILVAMMSGGDYIPEGVPGIGQKTACEAARARFGEDLCRIKKGDKKAITEWKERLIHELRTNESKHFKQKHKTLEIPDDFPRTDVLSYYTNPVVSSNEKVSQLKASIQWDQEFDLPGLRTFCAEAFDWVCVSGAKHFIRNLSRALLVRSLRMRADESSADDEYEIATREAQLIKTIHNTREHPSTDRTRELRVGFRPLDIVPIDLDNEEPDPEQPISGVESDEEAINELDEGNELVEEPSSPKKKRKTTAYDPNSVVKDWVFETYVKVGVPLKIQDWEESFRNAKKYELMKNQRRRIEQEAKGKQTSGGGRRGALDAFTKVTKPGMHSRQDKASSDAATLRPRHHDKVDTMEPLPLSQPLHSFRSKRLQNESNDYKVVRNNFRAPPPLPSSSPSSEDPSESNKSVHQLPHSSSSFNRTIPSKRPLQRFITDPFNSAEDAKTRQSFDISTEVSSEFERKKGAIGVSITRSPFRRSQTLPQFPDDARDDSKPFPGLHQTTFRRTMAISGGSREDTSIPNSNTVFGKPSAQEKLRRPQTPRAKRNGKATAFSPIKTIEITSSPGQSAGKVKQQPITTFLSSSSPVSQSPARTRRKRELSPFYANSRSNYEYSHISRPAPPRTSPEAEQDTGANENASQVQQSFLEEFKVERHDRTGETARDRMTRGSANPSREPLQETNSNSNPADRARNAARERKRVLRLRDSLRGAYALDDIVEHESPMPRQQAIRTGKRWRFSEVELVDLTG